MTQTIVGAETYGQTVFEPVRLHDLVIYSNNDDWQALFKDGLLVEQGHEITPFDLGKHCPAASIAYEEMEMPVIRRLYEIGEFAPGTTLAEARALVGEV